MKLITNRKEVGTAIVLVISIMATLMVIVGVAMEYSTNITRHVQRSNTFQNAIAIGDGTMDMMFGYWREVCRTQPNMPMDTEDFNGDAELPLPTTTQFPNVPNFTAKRATQFFANGNSNNVTDTNKTISNYKIVAVDPQLNDLDDIESDPIPGTGQQATSATYNYIAAADITLPALKGKITTKVRRVFQKQQMSPWNYAIFYIDPLEIHPGPAFTVTGWVHTNSDLYTAHDSLTFADKVTYGHDWAVGFMPGDGAHSGETPEYPNFPSNLPPAMDVAKQPFGLDATRIFSTTDTNPNNDSFHELIEKRVSSSSDPLDGERYYDQAAIKVEIDGSNAITVRKLDGTAVSSSSSGDDKKLYDSMISALTTNQPIQDNRELASVRLASLDVGVLVTKLNNGQLPASRWNGVVYVADTSATSTARRGIRVKNGSVVPTGGLTLASANPVYIQGDFNTGGTGTSVPSNVVGSYNDPNTTPNATVSGYSKKPCSIITDAVNILSNSWNDANSSAGLGSRVASNTTVNTAIVSGIVQSSGGNYSGGAENFPRFLEDWSNKNLTYYGSMVELYASRQSTGTWGKANVYSPPIRKWFFDKGFYTYTPPGTLMIYSYVKGKWALVP